MLFESKIKTIKDVKMKFLISVCLLLISFNASAVQTTARPFSFELYADSNAYSFDVSLRQSCRHEVPVWSDSAEYKTIYNDVVLKQKITKVDGTLSRYRFSLDNTETLSLTGFFKYNKECRSSLRIVVSSKIYAVGWANQFSRPVEFKFLEEMYRYREYDTEFDPSSEKNIQLFSDKEVSFDYRPTASNRVNIMIMTDGKKVEGSFSTSAYKNDETNMPYRLKK